MKKLLILLNVFILFSCGMLLQKNEYLVTYNFVNKTNVSDIEKKETIEVLKKRLQKFTNDVDVSISTSDEILINLKTDLKIERLNSIVENQGKLDFWSCINKDLMISFILDLDRINATDSIPKPFSSLLQGMDYGDLPIFSVQDTSEVRRLLNNKKTNDFYIEDYKDLKLLFGVPFNDFVTLYGVKSNDKNRAIVNETHIVEVRQDYDQINRPAISINMNEYGAHNWSKMTNEAYLNNTRIAIALNDNVYSAPTVSSGPITGGRSQISGDFSIEEAQNLAYIFSSQKSIPKLKFISVSKLEN